MKKPKRVRVYFCANCGDVGGADPIDHCTDWDFECKCPHKIPAIASATYVLDPKRKRRR